MATRPWIALGSVSLNKPEILSPPNEKLVASSVMSTTFIDWVTSIIIGSRERPVTINQPWNRIQTVIMVVPNSSIHWISPVIRLCRKVSISPSRKPKMALKNTHWPMPSIA